MTETGRFVYRRSYPADGYDVSLVQEDGMTFDIAHVGQQSWARTLVRALILFDEIEPNVVAVPDA